MNWTDSIESGQTMTNYELMMYTLFHKYNIFRYNRHDKYYESLTFKDDFMHIPSYDVDLDNCSLIHLIKSSDVNAIERFVSNLNHVCYESFNKRLNQVLQRKLELSNNPILKLYYNDQISQKYIYICDEIKQYVWKCKFDAVIIHLKINMHSFNYYGGLHHLFR